MMLVSLTQASDYIRRDGNADDAILTLLIEAASEAIANYLGEQAEVVLAYTSFGEPEEDSSGVAVDVPAVVQGACLYLTAWFYRNRDSDEQTAFQPGYLPAVVTSMLYPLRDPMLA